MSIFKPGGIVSLSPKELGKLSYQGGILSLTGKGGSGGFSGNPGSKHNATSTIYKGVRYQSRAEAEYAYGLDCRLSQKEIRAWTRQISIPFRVNGILICKYVVDFCLLHLDGSIEWVEVKGHETDAYKIKKKLFEATYLFEHPEERYTIIKA